MVAALSCHRGLATASEQPFYVNRIRKEFTMKTSHQMEAVLVVNDRICPLNVVFMIKYSQINIEIWGTMTSLFLFLNLCCSY